MGIKEPTNTRQFTAYIPIFTWYNFTRNLIELSAVVHELSCPQTFLPYLAMVKNPNIWSCAVDLNLWPWNPLGFKQLSRNMLAQTFIELSATVHELSCTQRKKLRWKQYCMLLPWTV